MKIPTMNKASLIYAAYNTLSESAFSDVDLINKLITVLRTNQFGNDFTLSTLLSDFQKDRSIDYIGLIELIGLIHQKRKENAIISNTDERKHNGIYYTNYVIAKRLAEDTIGLFENSFDPVKLTFLEPCSGTGIFAIAYLDTVFQLNDKYLKTAQKIIDNLYFADIDGEALAILQDILPAYLRSRYGLNITIPTKNLYVGDVLFKLDTSNVTKVDLKSIFGVKDGFDIVLTNPPYKLLKANSNKYNGDTDNYKEEISKILSFIRKNNVYNYNSGTLNLYKLFVEEIIEKLTNNKSKIGLLIPSTLLSDKQSFGLRNRILHNYSFSTIYTIPEKNNFFLDITQAFCFFALNKEKTSQDIRLKINIVAESDIDNSEMKLNKSDINAISSQQEIVSTGQIGWKILNKIHKHHKINEISSIRNLRGELDLTLDKKFITHEATAYSLLRGNGVKEFNFSRDDLFVQNNFVKKLNGKAHYLQSERIVCQQISNINLNKRLKFTKIPQNVVLGNSCNFIAINQNTLFNESNITLEYLLGVLNSFLLNWRFHLTSSNNHIGNYELDELPIAVPDVKQKSVVEDIVGRLNTDPNNIQLKAKLNDIVFKIYELDKNEASYILDTYQKNDVATITRSLVNQL